jgi:hypothetical protein
MTQLFQGQKWWNCFFFLLILPKITFLKLIIRFPSLSMHNIDDFFCNSTFS